MRRCRHHVGTKKFLMEKSGFLFLFFYSGVPANLRISQGCSWAGSDRVSMRGENRSVQFGFGGVWGRTDRFGMIQLGTDPDRKKQLTDHFGVVWFGRFFSGFFGPALRLRWKLGFVIFLGVKIGSFLTAQGNLCFINCFTPIWERIVSYANYNTSCVVFYN